MNFPAKIYLDGGDPEETQKADELLKKAGYHGLDGQTTNPTLIAKNLVQRTKNQKLKISREHGLNEYKRVVQEMSRIIPKGKISIQVIGDPATLTHEDMLSQARDRILWIPNAVIKFPCTSEGLKAAEIFCQEGPVNITLTFSQQQAAAVYAATKTHNYDVYVSPFVGRLDDKAEKGMDVVANILEMYRAFGDGHVQVLTASVRNIDQLMYALWLKSDVVTLPYKIIEEWAGKGFHLPPGDFIYDTPNLVEIPYRELSLDNDWTSYDISHELTAVGLSKFWEDWKTLVRETD